MTSPMVCCTPCAMRRRRRLKYTTMAMTTGAVARAIRVSFQSIHIIHPSRPSTATESRTSTVTARVAASVTCWASKVTLEMSVPDATLS